ncbi:hypothetical protein [Antrihabitans sp. YC2-6]|uniref:hypothetical protein n=1 Tax=Antrihabitans sp. YC2-6 TaxID=2799498 RepID=UPI0018F57F48|nr:hypothetical protein [Antrihabitans sp. YC2-6]MBJ8346160.1 hypothetical protein [Antrihabitans sp. YC2-6]
MTAGIIAIVHPGTASAAGLDINAVDNGACKVTFSMENRTNTTAYTMDYWIDDEPLTGQDYGTGPTGRRPPLTSGVDPSVPQWPGNLYRNNVEPPFHTEQQVNLAEVANLPNPGAATHEVHYRVILGPEANDRIPVAKTTTVTGCGGGGTGSAGSSNFPPLFGS